MPDSYRCWVCGATNGLAHIFDESVEDALVCYHHRLEISKRWGTEKIRDILESMGVKFGDSPMDVNYKDGDFLRDCGIAPVEIWEWRLAKIEGIKNK